MFRKHTSFLILSIDTTPVISLGLKCLFLAPVSFSLWSPVSPYEAQFTLIGQLAHSIVIGHHFELCKKYRPPFSLYLALLAGMPE